MEDITANQYTTEKSQRASIPAKLRAICSIRLSDELIQIHPSEIRSLDAVIPGGNSEGPALGMENSVRLFD